MAFSYHIDRGQKLIVTCFSGPFDADAFIACIEQLWADPDYDRTFEGFADITLVDPTFNLDDIRRVIAFLRDNRLTNIGRWAVITDTPLAAAGAYFYQKSMATVHHIEVFSTREAACNFLGRDITLPTRKSAAPVV